MEPCTKGQWTVRSPLPTFGNQFVSIQGALRYDVEHTDAGPEGPGYRVVFTLLFPR
ncbi:MAG: hypothetical protein ACREQ1_00375 [Woeseiaceae bacterium]